MLSRTQAFRAVNGSRAACIVPQTQCHRSLVARASSDAVRELEAFAQKVQHDMVAATEQPKPSTSRPVVMAAEVRPMLPAGRPSAGATGPPCSVQRRQLPNRFVLRTPSATPDASVNTHHHAHVSIKRCCMAR